jgi:hypothetical protein
MAIVAALSTALKKSIFLKVLKGKGLPKISNNSFDEIYQLYYSRSLTVLKHFAFFQNSQILLDILQVIGIEVLFSQHFIGHAGNANQIKLVVLSQIVGRRERIDFRPFRHFCL